MMDLGFGPDVHSAGRLVHNQNVAFAGQPFRQGNFLLIAAAQTRDGRIDRWRFDAQLFDVLFC